MSADPRPWEPGHNTGLGMRLAQKDESHSPWSHCRFHLAATRGNVDCLEAMLAHGVDAMTKDSSGEGVGTTCAQLVPWTDWGYWHILVVFSLLDRC